MRSIYENGSDDLPRSIYENGSDDLPPKEAEGATP